MDNVKIRVHGVGNIEIGQYLIFLDGDNIMNSLSKHLGLGEGEYKTFFGEFDLIVRNLNEPIRIECKGEIK
mgnify:FL=1|jgi:hypothetical protein|nr:MAG TPA: hypothetical protein [Bacteriophage sp.]